MKGNKEIKYLLERYINRKATKEERSRLFAALSKEEDSKEWEQTIKEMIEQQSSDPDYDAKRWEPVITHILQQESFAFNNISDVSGKRVTWYRIAVAAAIVFLAGLGIWFALQSNYQKPDIVASNLKKAEEIHPGGNKAVLTLANGKKIALDSSNSGLLSMQGGTKVVKVNNGLLAYNRQPSTINHQPSIQYNTITTPRGGQYKVVLPDGSKVWLNAASSIRFPTAFTSNKRIVEITGEAYFEITSNPAKPFTVYFSSPKGGGQKGAVKVLGTQFNIMAYAGEPAIKTTLLEGSVKVSEGKSITRLHPGEQLSMNKAGETRLIKNVNISEAVAWKNGLFQFSDADIATIMRQIARWYNIQIVYANGIPSGTITGKIPRNTNLSNVLKIMQLSGVHFKVEGRKVTVLNS